MVPVSEDLKCCRRRTYTLQADTARLSSSTQASSHFIQVGWTPSTCDGLMASPADNVRTASRQLEKALTVSVTEDSLGVEGQSASANFPEGFGGNGAKSVKRQYGSIHSVLNDSLDTSGRRGENVSLSAEDKDERADEEDDCRQKIREPEPNVFFGVDHADLTSKRADVDEHVEIHE
jgi:hypothetical protein